MIQEGGGAVFLVDARREMKQIIFYLCFTGRQGRLFLRIGLFWTRSYIRFPRKTAGKQWSSQNDVRISAHAQLTSMFVPCCVVRTHNDPPVFLRSHERPWQPIKEVQRAVIWFYIMTVSARRHRPGRRYPKRRFDPFYHPVRATVRRRLWPGRRLAECECETTF